jgi:hypothetical protein
MNTIPTNTVIAAVLLIALVIGFVAWLVIQKQRTLKLKQRFGPEYDLTVSELGTHVTRKTRRWVGDCAAHSGGCCQIHAGVERTARPLHR